MVTLLQFKGAFMGLRVGDALGAPVETLAAGTYAPITDYQVADPRTFWAAKGYVKGDFTDDTSMAICLAESLINRKGHDASNQLHLYKQWAEKAYNSCGTTEFGMGGTTRKVLERYNAYNKGEIKFDEIADKEKPTNGGVMRLTPAILAAGNDLQKAIELAEATTVVTHASAEAVRASKLFGVVLWLALHEGKSAAFDRSRWVAALGAENVPVEFLQTPIPYPELSRANGFTAITSVQVALAAVERAENFSAAVLDAVNRGQDTDTYGALAGTLSGALWGLDAIPRKWVEGQKLTGKILMLAEKLFKTSGKKVAVEVR